VGEEGRKGWERGSEVKILTVKEIAERLGVSRQAVEYRIKRGHFGPPAVRLGSTQGWTEEQVLNFKVLKKIRDKAKAKLASLPDPEAESAKEPEPDPGSLKIQADNYSAPF